MPASAALLPPLPSPPLLFPFPSSEPSDLCPARPAASAPAADLPLVGVASNAHEDRLPLPLPLPLLLLPPPLTSSLFPDSLPRPKRHHRRRIPLPLAASNRHLLPHARRRHRRRPCCPQPTTTAGPAASPGFF
ncbi:hypothetical protein GQ55_2G128700 [Panicum hallii var. hallii]|uniref:Uncharacterized protein n=1 Tax=Panicum hallii var. hallii TaxID=1504633 RepID=A0A2T7EPB8_9POAL|nr:hypothetical protein GQ55_2G128700 [Panicum hallii var. hallii]